MNTEEIFSIRLVISDFYMEKPIFGLDPCYSEFRGKEIKRVPIIRIFGSNTIGQKTCMHIHGVFPYFYIPYEKQNFESFGKAAYQIASNLDKAINISLGQGSSAAQHIFKIQLVKGIPFYGYHRAEHQFLKIYLYNPRFVRRAANLLQNGAIMGKNFHPHESHVPYILQFMIDYNLYGMSFLHVPFEIVKFRKQNDDDYIPYPNVTNAQTISCSIATKQSSSSLEVDIGSNFILNRFQIITKTNTNVHTNPGIESIWQDEKIRRHKLILSKTDEEDKLNTVPVLEVPSTQERPNVQSTESEIFYRTALISKLFALEDSVGENCNLTDQTFLDGTLMHSNLTDTTTTTTTSTSTKATLKEQKRTFNLQKLLANAVYPGECTQDEENLINASHVENHLSNNSIFKINSNETLLKSNSENSAMNDTMTNDDENTFLDDTIIDEELIVNLTQNHVPLNASLRDEDVELLDVLCQLEEGNNNKNQIDLDSTLAPLSQQHKYFDLSPELLDKETAAAAINQPTSDNESDSEEKGDNTDLHDFSIAMDDIDELILKLTQSQPSQSKRQSSIQIPQIDGSDDIDHTPIKLRAQLRSTPPSTPKGRGKNIRRLSLVGSPTRPPRSPRTPKPNTASKYAPLPLIITKRSNKKNDIREVDPLESALTTLNKRLATRTLRHKSQAIAKEMNGNENPSAIPTHSTKSRKSIDLDKTHITCSLTPIRKKRERVLKVENVEKCEQIVAENNNNNNEVVVVAKQSQRKSARIQNALQNKKLDNITKEHIDSINSSSSSKTTSISNNHNEMDINDRVNKEKLPIKTLSPTYDNVDDDDDDEVVGASDNEAEKSVRVTPYLKRLRRSLQYTSHGIKRIKCNNNNISSTVVKIDTPPIDAAKTCANDEPTTSCSARSNANYINDDRDDDDDDGDNANDGEIHSFYEKSYIFDSPSMFSDASSPPVVTTADTPAMTANSTTAKLPIEKSSLASSSSADASYIITPLEFPPTYGDVLASCVKFGIQEYEFQNPYYSNPDDITKSKEIGYTVLQIPGNKLNDYPEFQSVFGTELNSLNAFRRKKLLAIGGPSMLNRFRTTQQIREYCASNKQVIIEPNAKAPTRQEAKLWLKAREMMKTRHKVDEVERDHNLLDDSPIKVRRQKVTMMLNEDPTTTNNDDDDDDGANEELENSVHCLTLTPEMRVNECDSSDPTHRSAKSNLRNKNLTAIFDNLQDKQSNDSSTSISSQSVLAELERLSFVNNLQSDHHSNGKHEMSFGLSIATLNNTFGFKVNLENLQEAKSDIEYNYLTIITLEVFVPTREDLYPNPQFDEIRCIFYAIENSIPNDSAAEQIHTQLPHKACGYIIVNDAHDIIREGNVHGIDTDIAIKVVQSEIEAIEALLELCALWDPDIYAGYEIEMASWGYIIERAKCLCLNIAPLLSRVPKEKMREFVDEDRDQFTDLDIEIKICGRILLDVWRLMRSEIALTSYTFENVTYHILHKRCPLHSYRNLTSWFAMPCSRWIVIEYYLERVRGTLALLDQLDLIGRTSEMAKLIGIQFYEVLSRGSQFRVESMMLRIAKPKNLVPFSPSVQQRAHMRAPEYLALIMEPQSRFYADPLIVLDFQSLYPSMIIAYNYCFSTCLGRVEHLGQSSSPFEFGASQLRVSPKMLRKLIDRDLINISPCGVVFVKSSVREGILPRMLTEILNTRQMVKQSMKLHKKNSALQRILHSRQLGLKLMANVTYGYTAANFSGRMPAVEVGDSVVSKGRETLERAIRMVETNKDWNVKVVYGDTDSMFILVPGRNRAQAFAIGEQIAEAVTQANPHPVKLKLEKVYQPCILQTKKRYVGYMYETADQTEAVYEAKGIETVRRDGCPAVAKMLEKVLRILFETADVSKVKEYVCRQFTKLLSGRANLQDLIFAKEFRGLNGYKPTACVPALELTRKWLQIDPRRIPRRGERVPFIIVNGPPGVPLIRLVRCPHEVLANEGLKINAIYYITKAIIPPLNRCLLLIGADVNEWFTNLPRKILITPALSTADEVIGTTKSNQLLKKCTISQYFSTTNCLIDCGRQTKHGICMECQQNPQKSVVVLHDKMAKIERGFHLTQQICQACCGRVGDLNCSSLDCPVLYVYAMKQRNLKQIMYIRNLLERF